MDGEQQTGSIGTFDPETGERKTQTFSYTPAPPPGPMDQLPNLMRAMYTSLPVEDAERAVSAAIQFQGLRGYRRDLDSGTDATTALAKWGPLMFYQKPNVIAPMAQAFKQPKLQFTPIPGGGTAMTYGSQLQHVAPQKPTVPVIRSVGGGIYQISPDGTTKTLVEPVQKPTAPTLATRSKVKRLEKEIDLLEKQKPPVMPPHKIFGVIPRAGNQAEVDEFNKQIAAKEKEIERIGGGPASAEPEAEPEPETEGETIPQAKPAPLSAAIETGKPLDRATAAALLKRAKGDKAKARQLARQLGYTF